MSKEISKSYILTIKIAYDTGEEISETDMNVEVLRKEIQESLENVFPVSKGNITATLLGSVEN